MENLQAVIRKVMAGDRDAYSAIVQEHQDMLLAYAAFRLPDAALVDEVVQQTFIRAFQQLSDFKPDKDFGVWLRTICKFMILAELQRNSRDRSSRENYRDHVRRQVLASALDAAPPGDRDPLELLERCLSKLQDRSRTLVEYRYEQALKIDEIARRLGESVTWVATTLFRVRESIRKCMEQQAVAG